MLITRTNPAGIDWYIQQLQTRIHDRLVFELELDDAAYQAYGRCYRNKTADGYKAEVYTESGEYADVFWNDSLTALSFFGVAGTEKRSVGMEANVGFIMFANLDRLALTDRTGVLITHRADEELRQTVLGIIGKFSDGFTVLSVDLHYDTIMRDYPGQVTKDMEIKVTMHPVTCFRINLKLLYNPNKIC